MALERSLATDSLKTRLRNQSLTLLVAGTDLSIHGTTLPYVLKNIAYVSKMQMPYLKKVYLQRHTFMGMVHKNLYGDEIWRIDNPSNSKLQYYHVFFGKSSIKIGVHDIQHILGDCPGY